MERIAVIDCGTNAFSLLIAELDQANQLHVIARDSDFVFLARNGIEHIRQDAFDRGIDTLIKYRKLIDKYQVTDIIALGTEALRVADNGPLFLSAAKETADINLQIISGEQEARYVYEAIRHGMPLDGQKALMMDIGGGSVEFVIGDADNLYWAQSFPAGISVMHRSFQYADPITNGEIYDLQEWLGEILAPMFEACKQFSPTLLAGTTGTFDVLRLKVPGSTKTELWGDIPVSMFPYFRRELVDTSIAGRREMGWVPGPKIEFITVGMILIDFVIRQTQIKSCRYTRYSLKQGAIYSRYNNR